MDIEFVKQIYKLRQNFIVIGLTGRTGSGCSTVADILCAEIGSLKSSHKEFNDSKIDNDVRKNRIIDKFIRENWKSFTSIKASDVIFFFALLETFEDFMDSLVNPQNLPNDKSNTSEQNSSIISAAVENVKERFNEYHALAKGCNDILEKKAYFDGEGNLIEENFKKCKDLLFEAIPRFRSEINRALAQTTLRILGSVLQSWGNNIRRYNSIIVPKGGDKQRKAPSYLAHKINMFIKAFRAYDKVKHTPTLIVIDALRNPYEVLYFRERYSAFYLMSVNTTEVIRQRKLYEKGYRREEVEIIDHEESAKHDFAEGYSQIDIDKCIELSDIHLTHDGTGGNRNRNLINQIFKYVALILHPGLVPPSPLERCMQIAYTAKLNSGCLSRQVGAVMTNDSFSVKSIGWNTVAEGQTPCSLRCLHDLACQEDEDAFSNYEKSNPKFKDYALKLDKSYEQEKIKSYLKGLTVSYCFKDIHNTIEPKHLYNQVHTRSLHAEENTFLQLAKFGSVGIKGGLLFTTASCCELCAKKAYQLGIKKIYYIDSYPGISQSHILESGDEDCRPKMILFQGAIGRAYVNLYNPFVPLKDEVEARTTIKVKQQLKAEDNSEMNDKSFKKDKDGINNKDK